MSRSATQTFPVRRFPRITHCSCSIMMTNEDSYAAGKRHDTVFSNFLSKLRHSCRLSVFVNSHFVRDLRCKTKKPTEQWGVICDTHTCVLFSGNSKSSTRSFHFSHSHFHTTADHVITLRWSLRNHFHSCTCVNHRILECSCSIHCRISK